MFDFYQKRKLKSVVNSRYTQGLILLLALMVSWSAYVRYDIAMEMKDRRQHAEQEAVLLEIKKNELEKKVEYLSSERGVEAEMRRQFDVALPGEKVVVIVDDEENGPEVRPLSSQSTSTKVKWYQFWR